VVVATVITAVGVRFSFMDLSHHHRKKRVSLRTRVPVKQRRQLRGRLPD
jgi:hypothetical protein